MTVTSPVVSRRPMPECNVPRGVRDRAAPPPTPSRLSRQPRRVGRPVILLLAAVAFAVAAVQGPTGGRADAAGTGWLRFGHFAPVVGEVDVVVDGKPFAIGIAYQDVSEYLELPAGRHIVEVRPGGDRSAAALVSSVAVVEAGGAVTVAALSTPRGVEAQVYRDGTAATADGRASVRFIHAASEAPAVDISTADGSVLAEELSYPRPSDYLDVAPGTYDMRVTDAASGAPVLLVEGWAIDAGVQASVVVVAGSDGMLDVVPLVDFVAVAVAPTGGAETGFGGMAAVLADESDADGRSLLPLAPLLLVPVLSVAGLILATRRRPAES